MCLSIPGQVVEISSDDPEMASVEQAGICHRVDVSMLDDLRPGDWVLVHSGFAMAHIDEDEARATLQMLDDFARTTADAMGP
ncbi:MAG: HypC/HybG/HupF family hydrogenase formation chaperone [Streptosporangiales bacterium]